LCAPVYLMRHFATESGKSKGQFYTPAEVSRIMAKVISIGSAESASQSVHDPTVIYRSKMHAGMKRNFQAMSGAA